MATVASLRMLSIGPVQFPVDVSSVVPSAQSFRSVCCGTPDNEHEAAAVKQPKVCPICGEVADRSQLRQAAKVAGGYVLIDEQTQAKVTTKIDSKKIVLRVHSSETFHRSTVPGPKSYWLHPSKDSDPTGYNLFRSLVSSLTDYSFVAVWAARSKPTMFELTMHDGVLMISERVHVENANPAPGFIEVNVGEQDIKNMQMIATSMLSEFKKEDYTNNTLSEILQGAQPIALHGDKASEASVAHSQNISEMLASIAADIENEAPKPKRTRKPRTTTRKTTAKKATNESNDDKAE